jgi:hypothetical protein
MDKFTKQEIGPQSNIEKEYYKFKIKGQIKKLQSLKLLKSETSGGLGSPLWSWIQLGRPGFQPIRVRFTYLFGLLGSWQTHNSEFVDVSWFMTLFTLGIMVGLRLNVASFTSSIYSLTSRRK